MTDFGEHYRRGLGMSARNNALAYGYSVTTTASFGMLAHTAGRISVLRVFMFVLGSGIAFAGINALVTRGFRRRVEQEPPVVVSLATAFAVISISAAVGLAALIGWGVGGWLAWLLGSLLPTWAYLSIAALEMAIARNVQLKVADEHPDRR
jgi:MFS family permease